MKLTGVKAHLYANDEEPYDQRDENYASSEDYESYYCEICDREFSSEDCLSEHKREHKICGIDGCTFSAHPLLVEKHIAMQHSSGLYHRLKNISTPEDIQKWITERKKRYPTKVNIESRKAEETEKIQRGEMIKQHQDVTKRRKKKFSRSHNRKRTIRKEIMGNNTLQQKEVYRGLHKFPGTLNLQIADSREEEIDNVPEEDINHISDEEEPSVTLSESAINTSCAFTLVANYESGSGESDGPEEVPIKKVKVEIENVDTKQVVNKNKIVDAPHIDINVPECFNSKFPAASISTTAHSKCKGKQMTELNRHLKGKRREALANDKQPYKSQLLQRLLSRSIQHERNLICQCIKYIVDNNFFD